MANGILPIHPEPGEGKSLIKWLIKIAEVNKMEFATFFTIVGSIAREEGFFAGLSKITGYPRESIENLENALKPNWEWHPLQCPFLGCHFITIYEPNYWKHFIFHVDFENSLKLEYKVASISQKQSELLIQFKKYTDLQRRISPIKDRQKSLLDWMR